MSGNVMDSKLIKDHRRGGIRECQQDEGELKKFYEPRPENVRHIGEGLTKMTRST